LLGHEASRIRSRTVGSRQQLQQSFGATESRRTSRDSLWAPRLRQERVEQAWGTARAVPAESSTGRKSRRISRRRLAQSARLIVGLIRWPTAASVEQRRRAIKLARRPKYGVDRFHPCSPEKVGCKGHLALRTRSRDELLERTSDGSRTRVDWVEAWQPAVEESAVQKLHV